MVFLFRISPVGAIEELAPIISIAYRQVLFASLLGNWKYLGAPPCGNLQKPIHTYRLCLRGRAVWHDVFVCFNPLEQLGLIAALAAARSAVRMVMDRIWRDGRDLSTERNCETATLG